MPEEWVECPICGRELENVGTGLLCEEHGEFNYNFRCPLCGSRVQNLVSTPTVCRCPNPTCENNTALFTAVNNPGLDFARRQFLKSGGQGKDRKIAREILRGDVKKTHNGKDIGNFGGAGTKRYFDDHDVDRIFGIWDIYAKNINPSGIDMNAKGAKPGMAVHIPALGRADTSEADALRAKATEMKDKGMFSRFIARSRGRRPLPAVMNNVNQGTGPGGGGAGGGGAPAGGGGPVGGGDWEPAVPGSMPCPDCGNMYPLIFMNAYSVRNRRPLYHCNRCMNIYELEANGHLHLQHAVDVLPDKCPVCGSPVHHSENKNEPGIWRIQCNNPACQPGLEPWHVDLQKREFDQWFEVRKRLKLAAIANVRSMAPLAKSRLQKRRLRELERMESMVKSKGYTDVFAERLGLTPADLAARGLEPTEHKRFPGSKEYEDESKIFDNDMADKKTKEYRNAQEKGKWYNAGGFYSSIRHNTTKATSAGIVEVIGIIIGAIYGWPFLLAATCWALRRILPEGTGYEMQKDFEKNRFGSLFATRQNRYSTGLGATKSLLKVSTLLFAGIGMFGTELPFRGLMLLVFFFMAYFSLPAEYSSSEPYKFLEGLGKPVIAIILSFWVFQGIFQSMELAWLCMAFFAIFPVATERENLARAIGIAGSGTGAVYENLDKVIFIVFMIIGYISVMGGSGLNLDFLMGSQATVFFFFWIVAGVGGIMSPASTRPYTGIMMLAMVFLFYSSGAGEQIVGQGFFGAWWPTVHNAVTSMTTPFGEAFGAIGETFGSTFKLLTNPTGFAKDIMEGSYEKNPTGATGAYGVEINDLVVPAIQPGTLSMTTFTIRNEGPAVARDVSVSFGLPSYLKGVIAVGHGDDVGDGGYITESNAVYTPGTETGEGQIEEFLALQPQYAVPLLFMIDARDCNAINDLQSKLSRLSKRNEYVRVNVSVEYEYEASSWIPVEIISVQEWQDRTAKGTFSPSVVGSHVSTSPAKLSLGTFAQPIVAGRKPFYIGLNMTSEEGPESEILWESEKTLITLILPQNMTGAEKFRCTPSPDEREEKPAPTSTTIFKWKGSTLNRGPVYCTSLSPADMNLPSKTFFARAEATFRFRKWVYKDTLFSFGDVCFPQGTADLACNQLTNEECKARTADCELVVPEPTNPDDPVCKIISCNRLGEAACKDRATDCEWVTPPGSTTASCTDKPPA